MGIMDLVRKMSERKAITKEKFREAQENMRIQKILEQRQKSSNERELERYQEEQREEQIKNALSKIRKKQQKDMWQSNSFLGKGMTLLKDDKPILKQKNIFTNNKASLLKQEHMFFK